MEKISVLDLTACICEVVDLVSDVIKDHHNRVACGSYYLTEAMGMGREQRRDIVIAAAVHDVGGLSLNDRIMAATLDFEDSNNHAEKGYRLLFDFKPFHSIAEIVRYHHTPWDFGKAVDAGGNPIPIGSQIVLMADRISVMLKPDIYVLNQTKAVAESIIRQENSIYQPELVAAFKEVSGKDAFWLDIMSQSFKGSLIEKLRADDIILSGSALTGALDLLSKIIDYRSAFTAFHSKGVSVVAGELCRLMNFPETECQLMKAAGLLHDIGKLAVPSEIIEKQGPLNENERNIIHSHTYYTEKVLSHLSSFDSIREWASYHHENLNGSGYPFGFSNKDLSVGSRIMKVADVFAALMENRPYRKSMGMEKSLSIMNTMADNYELDQDILDVLCVNAKEISTILYEEETKTSKHYQKFLEGLKK